jgi:hypothetical protein
MSYWVHRSNACCICKTSMMLAESIRLDETNVCHHDTPRVSAGYYYVELLRTVMCIFSGRIRDNGK